MNCIIIDDEPLAREELNSMLVEVRGPKVLGSFSNALAGGEFLSAHQVDLVFLDIEMPKMNGLEFIKKIPDNTLVIFTTAYPQYALESYELHAIDYLLKPFNNQRLQKAIEKAMSYKGIISTGEDHSVEKSTSEFLIIKSDKRFYKVNLKDVKYIEGLKDYVVIHTTSQKIIASMNLKTIHQKIPLPQFIRVSKSYVINSEHIVSFDSYSIQFNDRDVPVGEIYKEYFFKNFTDGLL